MNSALVGKSAFAYKRPTIKRGHIGDLAHITGHICKPREIFIRDARNTHLEVEIRYDCREIGIAAAFSVSVDCPLNHDRSGFNRKECICDTKTAVIMRVYPHLCRDLRHDLFHYLLQLRREHASICITEDYPVRPCRNRRFYSFCGIFRIVLVAVKEVFRVINDFPAIGTKIVHRIKDHGKILFQRVRHDLFYVKIPCLTKNSHRLCLGIKQRLEIVVFFRVYLWPSRASKGGKTCLCKFRLFCQFKEVNIFGI